MLAGELQAIQDIANKCREIPRVPLTAKEIHEEATSGAPSKRNDLLDCTDGEIEDENEHTAVGDEKMSEEDEEGGDENDGNWAENFASCGGFFMRDIPQSEAVEGPLGADGVMPRGGFAAGLRRLRRKWGRRWDEAVLAVWAAEQEEARLIEAVEWKAQLEEARYVERSGKNEQCESIKRTESTLSL